MKKTPIALLITTIVAAILSAGPGAAGAASPSTGVSHVVISVVDAGTPGDAAALAARFDRDFGPEVVTTLALDELDIIAADVTAVGRNALAELAEVTSISDSRAFTPSLDVSVPQIGAAVLHAAGLTGNGKAVVVIDSGVSSTTPALAASPSHAGSVIYEACFLHGADNVTISGDSGKSTPLELCPDGTTHLEGAGSAQPCTTLPSPCSHGTGVAGVVAAHEPGSPYIGVAPDAGIISMRTTAIIQRPGGSVESYIPEQGVLAALNNVVTISSPPYSFDIAAVNLSLGGVANGCHDTLWESVVSQLNSLGIAVVAASGNSGSASSISFPACLPDVVSVGASTAAGEVASFSDTSSLLDLVAPGGSVTTAAPTSFAVSGYMPEQGTSFSAPHVSGVYALLDSTFPSFDPLRIRNLLRSTGVMVPRPGPAVSGSPTRFPEVRADVAQSFVPFADATGEAFWIQPADWAKATGISTGIDGVNFGADGTLDRAQAVTFLWRFMDSPTASTTAAFTDLEPGRFYVDAVDWAAETGVTTGIPGNLFDPAGAVTRGQLATFMWRMVGEPFAAASSGFTDVPPGIWYATAVDWMAENGITTGTAPGIFSPDQVVTRAQMVTFLQRLASTAGAWTGPVAPPSRTLF